jgi:hypothetical protein
LTINGETVRTRKSSFEVKMERGLNRCEMRVTDTMGNKGASSIFECIFMPKGEQNPAAVPHASSGESTAPVVKVETIDTAPAWASPCWGYNAPKILRNEQGEMWAVNFFGKYGGHEQSRILKRTKDGRWLKGATFDSLYQPSMIFLDNEGRVNYIQNSQTLPIRHYRSTDSENLNHFSLVASGNGISDGRGWYVGAAVHVTTM